MLNAIITSHASIDNLLKGIGHKDDCRRDRSNVEIITTIICAAMFFDSDHSKAYSYMKNHNLIPGILGKLRNKTAIAQNINANKRFVLSIWLVSLVYQFKR